PPFPTRRSSDLSELPSLLHELERRLQAFGAPIVEAFCPGVSAETVRHALAAEGVRAPRDLIAWWGWHDGVTLADAPSIDSGPGVYLRSENTLVEDWHVLSLVDFVANTVRECDESLVHPHPADPRVPLFAAPALTRAMRRLSYW